MTHFILVPDMNPGRSSLHEELPPALPPVRTLKRHAQVSEVLPIGKKLRPVPGLGSIPLPENHPARNPARIDTQSPGREGNNIILPIPRKMTKDNRQVLPIPRVISHQIRGPHQPQKIRPEEVNRRMQPSTYSPAVYASNNPTVVFLYYLYWNIRLIYSQVWYNALMVAHNELRESPETRIPYGQAANFHIHANRHRLSEERETNAELKHLKSKLRGLQHMLQTRLNEV